MFDPMFVPPRQHPAVVWFANTFVGRLGRFFGNVHGLTVEPEDLARLDALRGKRAILCPNHPTETDPIVLYWLSTKVHQQFNYLTTRESLDGPRGFLLNRIGAYSVIRGFPDRESLKMTRKLLAEMDERVVIFPEGLVYEHNDKLLEFQSGVAQIGFWALDDLRKAEKELALPIVPVAVRYQCCADPVPYIERSLADLERTLSLAANPKADLYARLLRVGGQVLANLEKVEGIKPEEGQDLSTRIASVRCAMVHRVAHAIDAEVNKAEAVSEQLHTLTNELRAWVGVLPDEHTEYDERLHAQRSKVAAPLYAELMRLHNFVALSGDYVATEPTAERFLEVLGRLEKEVLGKVRHAAPLKAFVKVGASIPLEARYEEYRTKKRGVVADVTHQMEEAVRGMLKELHRHATPLRTGEPGRVHHGVDDGASATRDV